MSQTAWRVLPGRDEGTKRSLVTVLRDDILSARLLGGESVTEAELAERFSVSRTPVREAIAHLMAEGLLVRKGKSVQVVRPTPEELQETYEIRIALESLAARLGAPLVTDADIKAIKASYRQLEASPISQWFELHQQFHIQLASYARRPQLQDLIATMRARSSPYIRLYISTGAFPAAQEGHREIIEAFAARDGATAAAATQAHLSTTLECLIRYVDEVAQRSAYKSAGRRRARAHR